MPKNKLKSFIDDCIKSRKQFKEKLLADIENGILPKIKYPNMFVIMSATAPLSITLLSDAGGIRFENCIPLETGTYKE